VTLDLEETNQVLAVRLDNLFGGRKKIFARCCGPEYRYRDQLPIAVAARFARMLASPALEHQLPGHVTYTRFGPLARPWSVSSITLDIAVRIRSVAFPGAGARAAGLQLAVRKQYGESIQVPRR